MAVYGYVTLRFCSGHGMHVCVFLILKENDPIGKLMTATFCAARCAGSY